MTKDSCLTVGWVHVGMEIDFHHPDSDALELTEAIEDHYGAEKEAARIFLRRADGNRVSADDLLADHLAKAGKSFGDLTSAWGAAGALVLEYLPGHHALETKAGTVDIRRVRLAFRRAAKEAVH